MIKLRDVISHFFGVSGGPAALLGKNFFFEFLGVCFLGVSQPVHHFDDKILGCDFSFFLVYQEDQQHCLEKNYFSNNWEYVF